MQEEKEQAGECSQAVDAGRQTGMQLRGQENAPNAGQVTSACLGPQIPAKQGVKSVAERPFPELGDHANDPALPHVVAKDLFRPLKIRGVRFARDREWTR